MLIRKAEIGEIEMKVSAELTAVLHMPGHRKHIDAQQPLIDLQPAQAAFFLSLTQGGEAGVLFPIAVPAAPSPRIIDPVIDQQHLLHVHAHDPGRSAQVHDGIAAAGDVIKSTDRAQGALDISGFLCVPWRKRLQQLHDLLISHRYAPFLSCSEGLPDKRAERPSAAHSGDRSPAGCDTTHQPSLSRSGTRPYAIPHG